MKIDLTREQALFVAEKLESGRYRSATEVVQEALRLLMEHDRNDSRRAEAWLEEVRRKVQEGLEQADRGELLDAEEVFERVQRRLDELGKQRA